MTSPPNRLYRVQSLTVYVLRSDSTDRYYAGYGKSVQQELRRHNAGSVSMTRDGRPWSVVHIEQVETLADARRRSAHMRSWKNPRYLERMLGLTRLRSAD